MPSRRIILTGRDSIPREALARTLSIDGHGVETVGVNAVADAIREVEAVTVIFDGDEGEARREWLAASPDVKLVELKSGVERGPLSALEGGEHVVLPRPLNLEDLRLALRES